MGKLLTVNPRSRPTKFQSSSPTKMMMMMTKNNERPKRATAGSNESTYITRCCYYSVHLTRANEDVKRWLLTSDYYVGHRNRGRLSNDMTKHSLSGILKVKKQYRM